MEAKKTGRNMKMERIDVPLPWLHPWVLGTAAFGKGCTWPSHRGLGQD